MAAQDELFQLIKSLTPSEKRYFKVNGDSKSNYMQLFDAIDGQKEEYDEAALKKKYAKKPFIKYLSAEKKQLRDQIMRQIRLFHANRTIDNHINDLLQDEIFYRDKGLNELREKTILKAKDLASIYERFHLLEEILSRQLSYRIEFEQKKLTEPVIDLINEQKQLALTRATLLELQTKNRELFAIYRSGADIHDHKVESRLSMLISEVEIYRPRIANKFSLSVQFHRSYANYYHTLKNRTACFESAKNEYNLYQQNDHFKKEDSYNYKKCIANLVSRAHSAKETDWYLKALKELKSLPTNSFNEEGEVFQNVFFQEHLFYINNGDFEEAEALIPEIEKGLTKYAAKVNKARLLAFQFNIMIMYFLMHKFKEALKWCDTILNDNSEIKQNQRSVVILLLPIIHFELGHVDLVESYTRSAYRFLKAKKRLHDFERLVLKYLQGMPLSQDQVEFKEKLESFNVELEVLMKEPDMKMPLGMEEMSLWVKSKIEGLPMTHFT